MRTTRPSRRRDGGFSLTELMVVVVLIGLTAAIALPRLTRDRQTEAGQTFARQIARELQKARSQAITESLPMLVTFYTDRVEVRSYVRDTSSPHGGTTKPDPASTTPNSIVFAPSGAIVADVKNLGYATAPTAATLSSTGKSLILFTDGRSHWDDTSASVPTGTSIWVISTQLSNRSDRWRFRIDVNPLTGFVRVFSGLAA